jgi:hypothetical protein
MSEETTHHRNRQQHPIRKLGIIADKRRAGEFAERRSLDTDLEPSVEVAEDAARGMMYVGRQTKPNLAGVIGSGHMPLQVWNRIWKSCGQVPSTR